MELTFEQTIHNYFVKKYGKKTAENLLQQSLLLQYIIFKTKSADKGSKSRGSFANLYAIYVLVEDYVKKNCKKDDLLITMGAGDVVNIGENLLKK